jgi:iron complex transport system substrate-binding protein
MKTKKILMLYFAVIALAALVVGCGYSGSPNQPSAPVPGSAPENPPATPAGAAPAGAAPAEAAQGLEDTNPATFIFTDALGREVELPRDLQRIAPSGTLAQVVLYTFSPDLLVGLSNDLTADEKRFMDDAIVALPVFGRMTADTLNLEAIMVAAPQVIIDVGQPADAIAGNLDDIQARTGIPTIFIQMDSLETMITAYETLGELFDRAERASKMGDYISDTITNVVNIAAGIPQSERVRVFYAQADGLTAFVDQTIHSDVIDFVGAINVAQIEETLRGGIAEISMEQLILWSPDVVLFAPESIFDYVESRAEWGAIAAISEGRFYEVPVGPHNWMGRPPSVNRLIGIRWLANLLYPDIFSFDMAEEARVFYSLFYHYELTDAQIEQLLANSTFR